MEIVGASVEVNGGITISHLGTGALLTEEVSTVNIEVGESLSAKFITLTNGSGNFLTHIVTPACVIDGNITIKNGNTMAPSDAMLQPGTKTMLDGSFHLGGSLSITNGNGYFLTSVTQDYSPGGLSTGGAVSIVNGNGLSLGNFIDVDTMSVAGGLTIKNGNVLTGIANSIEVKNLFVGGAVSFTSGAVREGWSLRNTITASENARLGSVTFKSGNGDVTNGVSSDGMLTIQGGVTFSGGNLNYGSTENDLTGTVALTIGGAVSMTTAGGNTMNRFTSGSIVLGAGLTLNHGMGYDDVTFSTDSLRVSGGLQMRLGSGGALAVIGHEGTSLAIVGSVNLTALFGNEDLQISGKGRIGGGVTANCGGQTARLTIDGGGDENFPGLSVGGIVTLGASADAQRTLTLQQCRLGSLSLTGGAGVDEVRLMGSEVLGAVRLDLLGGNDVVNIDDSTLRSTLTVLTGAGADTVTVEGDPNTFWGSRFLGVVNIQLGDGNDTLAIAPDEDPYLSATFLAAVTLDGGSNPIDTNSLIMSNGATFAKPQTVKYF